MTTIQTSAVVACRVLGLYFIMTWLGFFAYFGVQLFREQSPGLLLASIFLLAIQIGSVVLVWKSAPWIAKRMLANVEDTSASLSATTMEEVQAVAISILGIYFMVHAFPEIFTMVLAYFRAPGIYADIQSGFQAHMLKGVVMRLTEMGLGIWLFFGAKGFARVFQKFNSPEANKTL